LEWKIHLIARDGIQVHVEYAQEVMKPDPINCAQTEELVNAGNGIPIFDLRKPCIRDAELSVGKILRDLSTQLFHFARGHSEPVPNFLDLFPRTKG
jgi:hypothetical protein